MSPSLLTTKLYFPPARTGLVPRPRLVERLNSGLRGPCTLISAPAGYGKTTLMSEWRAGVGREFPSAWLSLDAGDNDLPRFFYYLSAALGTLKTGLVSNTILLISAPQLPPPEAILTSLINELGDFPQEFVLVLDDYHTITTPAVHSALSFLIDHLPAQMHLAVLTRADPPLPLARLRAGNRLAEIRAEHLRFTLDETITFFKHTFGIDLPLGEAAKLESRSEGWAAGLQMAALSMQGRNAAQLADFISAFTGSHHYIVDYLSEEVLHSQPEPVRRFLLRTSILDRLCGDLCDAVLENRSWRLEIGPTFDQSPISRIYSQQILEYLERSNLFLLPLDEERTWYRFHHLFGDLLRQQLQTAEPDIVPELHRRASQWFEQNHDSEHAIQHALAAKDWSRAGYMMEEACQAAMRNGEIGKLLGWARSLPETALYSNPRLCINYAWASTLTGQFEAAEKVLAEIEPVVRENPILKVDWLAVQAYIARGKGLFPRSIEYSRQALEFQETESVESRAILALSMALTYWHMGDIQEAATTAAEAARLAEQAGNWHAWAIMLGLLARLQAAQGHLRKAAQTYLEAVQEHPGVPAWAGSGLAQSGLAALYYEWNDLDRAADYARAGLEYSRLTGHGEIQMSCHRLVARICQARGDAPGAQEALNQAMQAAREHKLSGLMLDRIAAEQVQIALLQGDIPRAVHWLEQVQGEYGASFHYPTLPLERAMLAMAQDDKVKANAILAERFHAAVQFGICYGQIEIRILQALAASDEEQAISFLTEALHMAEPEGYVRVFIDQGKALAPLLRSAACRGITPGYSTQLLLTYTEHETSMPGPSHLRPEVERLSERELEVLRLIASGCSNKEIADELVIAVGTVKRHTANIFQKLDAANRTQAVARARELNLL